MTRPEVPPLSAVEIDLGAVRRNLGRVARRSGRRVLCVVKADAYGHGAALVARALLADESCLGFVVARWEEAVELRRALGNTPAARLICLGAFPGSLGGTGSLALARQCVELGVEPVVSSVADAAALCRAAAAGLAPTVHVALDTGMAREGLGAREAVTALADLRSAGIVIASVFTHFVESEDPASGLTASQRASFLGWAANVGDPDLALHTANSAGALGHDPAGPELAGEERWVRVGGALYGLDLRPPGAEPALEAAMTVTSRLVQVRRVPAGATVGYNGRWTAPRDSLVGLLPLGYADGMPANPAPVLWHGADGAEARVEVVGKVSMDLTTVDLTEASTSAADAPRVGDRVTVLGGASGDRVAAAEHALRQGVPAYAITCALRARLPRFHRPDDSAGPAPGPERG